MCSVSCGGCYFPVDIVQLDRTRRDSPLRTVLRCVYKAFSCEGRKKPHRQRGPIVASIRLADKTRAPHASSPAFAPPRTTAVLTTSRNFCPWCTYHHAPSTAYRRSDHGRCARGVLGRKPGSCGRVQLHSYLLGARRPAPPTCGHEADQQTIRSCHHGYVGVVWESGVPSVPIAMRGRRSRVTIDEDDGKCPCPTLACL